MIRMYTHINDKTADQTRTKQDSLLSLQELNKNHYIFKKNRGFD